MSVRIVGSESKIGEYRTHGKEIDLCVCGHMKFKFMVRGNGNFFQGNAMAKYRKKRKGNL